MAALRDIARDFAAEIRGGIGWTIVYRTGRSWNALTIWSDIWNGEWETDDLNDAIGILKADPDAVIVNGYYCGHFGEGMTIDEIAAGIRWHYEGGHNRLADYCEVTQGRDTLEEGRKAAEAAGLPFCERLADGGDDEPVHILRIISENLDVNEAEFEGLDDDELIDTIYQIFRERNDLDD